MQWQIGPAYLAAFTGLYLLSSLHLFLPAGLRLATLWLLPRRQWWITFVAEVLAILLIIQFRGTFESVPAMLFAAVVPWCLCAGILWLFARPAGPLPSPESMMRFLLCGLAAAFANAAALVLINLGDDGMPRPPAQMLFSFAIGDFTGMLMVAPVTRLLLAQFGLQREPWRRVFANGLVFAPAVLVLVLLQLPIQNADLYPVIVALFPLLWVSYRNGWRAAALSLALLGAAVYSLRTNATFAGSFMQLQLLIAGAGFGALMIGISGESLRLQGRALNATIDMLSRRTRALADAANRLVSQQEEERKRIGADLHDQLGQDMTAIATRLRLVERAQDQTQMRDGLRALSVLVDDAHEHLRDAIQSLHPLVLDRFGLARALSDGPMNELARTNGVAYECIVDGDVDRLPPEIAAAVYRICQEATTNGVRHGCGGRIGISLVLAPFETSSDLTLRIDDDGGQIQLRSDKQGFGLQNMHDRADAIGAEYVFDAASGHPRHLLQVRVAR